MITFLGGSGSGLTKPNLLPSLALPVTFINKYYQFYLYFFWFIDNLETVFSSDYDSFSPLLSFLGYCVFIDAEHALDPALAEAIGVNTENLLLSQPDCGEQALSLVDTIIRSGSVDVVVVDSVSTHTAFNKPHGYVEVL